MKEKTKDIINSYISLPIPSDSITHAFFILDIDFFKTINDTFGHAFGDQVLVDSAKKIRSLFRDTDVLGRIGGDEFVVFMKNIASYDIALKKASQLLKALNVSYTNGNMSLFISVSIGIAFYMKDGEDFNQLYCNSDIALYHAKNNGKNQFVVYDKSLMAKAYNNVFEE